MANHIGFTFMYCLYSIISLLSLSVLYHASLIDAVNCAAPLAPSLVNGQQWFVWTRDAGDAQLGSSLSFKLAYGNTSAMIDFPLQLIDKRTAYPLPERYAGGTVIYWQVVPTASGTDAANCSVWTTVAAPLTAFSNYSTDFDHGFPARWTLIGFRYWTTTASNANIDSGACY
jgi:hypothetical protein